MNHDELYEEWLRTRAEWSPDDKGFCEGVMSRVKGTRETARSDRFFLSASKEGREAPQLFPSCNFDYCKGCGICPRECWTGCIHMVDEEE